MKGIRLKRPELKRPDIKGTCRLVAFILFAGVFLYSLYRIVDKEYSYYHDNKQYESLREQVVNTNVSAEPSARTTSALTSVMPTTEPPFGTDPALPAFPAQPLPYQVTFGNLTDLDSNGLLQSYSKLQEQNSDLVGWIRMPGFRKPLDYPVMQATDNEYYLTHDFDKKKTSAGSVFMDYANDPQADRNTVLYGHAMKDKTMFGNLKDYYIYPEEYAKLTKIDLDLLNEKLEFEVFSTYAENQDYNYRQTQFASDAEYLDFLQKIRSKSVHDYNVELSSQDIILTLSTCNYVIGSDYRTVIHARLVNKTVYKKPT